MDITCDVIKDLLPLYHDHVCSEDSRKLVDEHLAACSTCRVELEQFDTEFKIKDNIEDVKVIKRISRKWREDRASAFWMGSLLLSALASVGCFVSYNMIGSHLAADGTLIEPFALIPLFYIFGFIALLSGIILGITYTVKSRRRPK